MISRRQFSVLAFGAGLASAGSWTVSAPSTLAQTGQSAELTPEQWMTEWMTAGRPVAGGLHLFRFKDPYYVLLRPISWRPGQGQDPTLPSVEVPKGFVTDLASIPRTFWSLLRPDGEYSYPAIIHDSLYWIQSTSREQADLVFRYAMEDFKIDGTTAATIHRAVRAGGEGPWLQNEAARRRGERRVLKRFPEDPRVTWREWQKEPDVFASDR